MQQGSTVETKLKQRLTAPDPALEAAAAGWSSCLERGCIQYIWCILTTFHMCTEREVTVYFTADAADGMPWKFRPTQRMVKVPLCCHTGATR